MGEEQGDKLFSGGTWREIAARWLTAQSFTNILLIGVLLAIGWGLRYSMLTAIPNLLERVQIGYEKIDNAGREERRLIRDQYEKWIDRVAKNVGSSGDRGRGAYGVEKPGE